jgi:glucose dehydrogenase
MTAPQTIILIILGFHLFVNIVWHGTPQPNHNAFRAIAECVIYLAILDWGGFF